MQQSGLAEFLDRASTELLRMEEQNRLPGGILVNPEIYNVIADIRRRELEDGYPLMVLGLALEQDSALRTDEYRLTS